MKNLQTQSKNYADMCICQETNQIKCFVKFQLLHSNDMKKEISILSDEKILFTQHIEEKPSVFFKKLIQFEKMHQYKYKEKSDKKKYKTIYGVKLEILLPRNISKKHDRIKLVKNFISLLNPTGFRLPLLAYVVQRGEGTYIILLLSERESIGHEEYIRYNRNYFGKDGSILHKKGDVKLDADGNKIKEYVQFSKKTRIFVLDQDMKKIRMHLVRHLLVALKRTKRVIKFRFIIQKKKVSPFWHYFNRKCVETVNTAASYIEYMLNHSIDLQTEGMDFTEDNPYWYKIPRIPKYKEIRILFFKYKARFEKNEFHDKQNNIRKIGYKHVPLNLLKENIDILIKEFETDLRKIVPAAFY